MKNISCLNCKKKSNATCILNPEELRTLESECVEIAFKKGDSIVRQGTFSTEIKYLCMKDIEDYHRYIYQYQKQVPGRLATILLCLANKIYMNDTFRLPLSRTELADLTGTSRESVSRGLSDLHNNNIIKMNGKEITIPKENILVDISSTLTD